MTEILKLLNSCPVFLDHHNTCGTVNYTKPKSWITGNAMVVNTEKRSNISKKFLFFQLQNSDLNYLITGSGQPQITGDIKKHTIFLPRLPEQIKIANLLSTIDEKIINTQRRIEKAEIWKKGLLQQMFV